jgi:hypothetical protein
MPLQLKRRRQSVHAFIQNLHHAIVAAINIDLANPDRAGCFNVYHRVRGSNARSAQPSKTFTHPLKKPRPIVVPLIAIVFADEIGNTLPISGADCVKEVLRMEADLVLRTPKPKQI